MFTAEVELGDILPSCVRSDCQQGVLHAAYLAPQVPVFGGLCLVISLFIMVPKHGAEVLIGASKPKKTMMCLLDKVCVINKLHSRHELWCYWP